MKFKDNIVKTTEEWLKVYPPKRGIHQWADGRSAKELANYITKNLPNIPFKIAEEIKKVSLSNEAFEWKGEAKTRLPELFNNNSEGRNHDMIMFNDDVVVCIEAKADESLGNYYVDKEFALAGENKKYRIKELIEILYGNDATFLSYSKIRYQLITGLAGTIIEAKSKNLYKAIFLIVVFMKKGRNIKDKQYYSVDKVKANDDDIDYFIKSLDLDKEQHKALNNVDIWIKEIKINLD